MACTSPLMGFRGPKGKLLLSDPGGAHAMVVPCGSCIGCRMTHSRNWAIRCVHEAQMHHGNEFITLTYAPEHLPMHGSLFLPHFQQFMKCLRHAISPDRVRFFHCGEYGEENQRPHYHAILFGINFPDKTPLSVNQKTGETLYTSQMLSGLWPHGFATTGTVTFNSAAYVARYIMKKHKGDKAEQNYMVEGPDGISHNPETGEIDFLKPEYTTMSRRPGIGKTWFEKYWTDVYPNDQVVIKVKDKYKTYPPPRYYDKLLEAMNPGLFADIQVKRFDEAQLRQEDNTPERLAVREFLLKERTRRLIRPIEDKKHGT